MQYALIKNNLVENVAEGDQAWADAVAPDWQAVVDITNVTPAPGIEWSYANGQFTPPPTPPAPEPTPEPRHISVGAFYDRFADQKWPILSSDDLAVQGMIKDTQVRKYIDLDSAQLPAGLDMLIAKGYPIDKDAILNNPVQPNEKP